MLGPIEDIDLDTDILRAPWLQFCLRSSPLPTWMAFFDTLCLVFFFCIAQLSHGSFFLKYLATFAFTFPSSSSAFLVADDSNLFYAHKSLKELETTVNKELQELFSWLCANKLSLNIEKSVTFCPPQKLVNSLINLKINNQTLMHKNSIKYLGIMIDSHLNWSLK